MQTLMKQLFSKKIVYFKRTFFLVTFCFLSSLAGTAQDLYISGTVLDSKNDPVVGATVLVKGTTNGTTTGINGDYNIAASPDATLVFSFLGMGAHEEAVSGRGRVDVVMGENAQAIEDVVVIGYGTVSRKDLTGAVASVGSKTLNDRAVNSVGQALQGRMAGVYIVDNGNPHADVSLRIRGLGTVNDSNPLYVIDGVPATLGLNSINNEDIASVDVLKDASATAIYGSRGANGVVIITTKRGHGDGTLNIKANYGISQATNVPAFLNATQYASLNNQMLMEAGQPTNPDWADPELLGAGTDWIDAMLRTAHAQSYTLSYSGGSDKSNYYVSGGYTNQDGIVQSVGYKRVTLQFNGDYKVKSWVKFGNNITFSADNKTNGNYGLSEVFRSLPTQNIYDDDGNFDGPSGNPIWNSTIRNQYGTAMLDKNTTEGYNLLGNAYAEFSIIDGLKFKSVAGAQLTFGKTSRFTPKYDWKPNPVPTTSVYKGASYGFTYLLDNYFTYEKIFGDHSVNVMAGASLQWGENDYFNGDAEDFLKDEIHQIDNAKKISAFRGSGNEWSIASFMLRANYTYADRYLLTATVRRDGSSRFGPKHRWGTFPSFSAAWRLSEESFYDKNWVMSDVKIRAGYGITGNQNIGNYSFSSDYNTGVYAFNGNVVNSLVAHKMPNPSVHWEEVRQTNVGADVGFFKSRLRLSFDLYNKNTEDMLVGMSVPVSSGYDDRDVPMINAGKVNNKGVELNLSADIFNQKDFQWTADFNIAFNKNKIISLNSDVPDYYGGVEMSGNTRVNAEGHPIGSFYGHVANGLFQTQGEVDNWSTQIVGTSSINGTAAGDIRFLDLDNNGVIDDNDRTFIGNPMPAWTYALNNSFSYKGFDLSIFFQGIYGNDVFNANRMYLEAMSAAQNQMATVLDRWTIEGSSNSMPRAVLGDPNKNVRSSTRFIEDGSYLRLKDLTLGYTLPASIAKKIAMNNLRLYFSCTNLFTISNYSGFDPEISVNGFDLGRYPVTRTFSVGIDVKF
ncbi:SusC/RagA family TonB-linked outer membrane protein [Bacteroidia bacterium]|nr:SusC/RagA family TonB-linked outer membrane protein [Bacteroidia bacterium]